MHLHVCQSGWNAAGGFHGGHPERLRPEMSHYQSGSGTVVRYPLPSRYDGLQHYYQTVRRGEDEQHRFLNGMPDMCTEHRRSIPWMQTRAADLETVFADRRSSDVEAEPPTSDHLPVSVRA